MKSPFQRARMIAPVFLLVLILGCEPAREEIVHTGTGGGAEGPATTATALEGGGELDATPGGAVEVTLTDFRIDMPSTLPAGPTTFRVTNAGKAEHNFEVEGEGIETKLAQNLQPGESGSLEVDLQPGTYHVYCPVANHEERGMEMELMVTEPSPAGSTSL